MNDRPNNRTPAEQGAPSERTPAARKGRGATFNPGNRFRAESREDFDDGWNAGVDEGEAGEAQPALPRVATTVTIQNARTIIARNDSPDVLFTQSINPYQGCEHEIRSHHGTCPHWEGEPRRVVLPFHIRKRSFCSL
jgi:hypothetical protein